MDLALSTVSEAVLVVADKMSTQPADGEPDADPTVSESHSFEPNAQLSTEMEEGELPSEDCPSKPSTPIKSLNVKRESETSRMQEESETGISFTRKPVLGKEKAKQRLKALRIQNKLQMESRNNVTPKKQSTKHCPSPRDSNAKKDRKLMSPLEKAQLTIKEIEVMKREGGERPKVPICYHESMIHRITVDSLDSSNITQPTLPPSIEALKAYNDEPFHGEERKRKRSRPEAYRRRRRSGTSPLKATFHSSKRKLKFKRERSDTHESSRDRVRSAFNNAKKERRRSREQPIETNKSSNRQCSVAVRPGEPIPYQSNRGTNLRFTEARPVISYCFNRLSAERNANITTKLRKRSKKKRDVKSTPLISNQESQDGQTVKIKRKKKAKSKSKSLGLSERKPKKKKNKKSSKPKKQIGVLSFVVDDLNFEEESDGFPLSKEGFQPTADSDEQPLDSKPNQELLNNVREEASTPIGRAGIGTPIPDEGDLVSCAPSIHESTPDDRSPDTDDYMPNWEEEDEDSDKDETLALYLSKDLNEINNDDAYSSTEESTPESIKDGLGTPIFVNPSPPREMLEKIAETHDQQPIKSVQNLTKDQKESDEEESHTPPPLKPKHLFEMENIYEEFLRSVREDPDFQENQPNLSPTESNEHTRSTDEESGFLSQTSISLTLPTIQNSSISSPESASSDQSSKSDDSSDSETSGSESVKSANDTGCADSAKLVTVNSESIGEVSTEYEAKLNDEELSNISSGDLKKLRSLQKRHGMLKWIRQQIDGMDEEDRLCLLGLEKLLRAERKLLLRSMTIKKLHEQKNILGTDSESSNDVTDKGEKVVVAQDDPFYAGAILDSKREAIKLTITSQSPMKKLSATSALLSNELNKPLSDDDEDFTERLMKPKEKCETAPSRTASKSPQRKMKRRARRGRSLSVSPMRRSRKSAYRERANERSKRRGYSPSPTRTSGRRRNGNSTSRNRNSGSPSVHRLSKSRRNSYSPQSSPARSHSPSRSPSRSPVSSMKEERVGAHQIANSYSSWNIDRYSQYYVGDTYYFPNAPTPDGCDHKIDGVQSRYPVAYHDYPHYNMYASEYMNVSTNYQSEYAQQPDYSNHQRPGGTGGTEINPYLSIPVIGASSVGNSASYFYKECDFEEPHSPLVAVAPNIKCMEIHRQETSNSPKPFAVQKGNVLEIVPATTITSEIKDVAANVKEEPIDIQIKQEPVDEDDAERNSQNVDELKKIMECTVDIKVESKVMSKKNHSWKDEVARRHVVSAVMRLNKETEDSPRGILRIRGNSTVSVRDKKKVLFADGIPPGRSSSASSDEEATLKFIRKRLRKTHRRMQNENKENEASIEATDLKLALLEAKADPELWDAPPPPPPPGSPPSHLPQPVLLRPASPEELLYFHYDPVYNMMYVSPMENAIPPRLLQNNGKSPLKANVEVSPAAENDETTSEVSALGKGSSSPSQHEASDSPEDKEELADGFTCFSPASEKKYTPSPERNNSPTTPEQITPDLKTASPPLGPPPPHQQCSPPQQIKNIVSVRMSSNSPLLYSQCPLPNSVPVSPAYESPHPPPPHSPQHHHQSPASRAPIPILVGYPGQIFGRMPNRRLSPNVVRGPYSMPPPLHNRAFNPHIPPPFHQPPPPPLSNHIGSHPSPYENSMSSMPAAAPQPSTPFNQNMILYGGSQPQQQQQAFSFNIAPHTQAPLPHLMLNRPPARFSSISTPVVGPKFLHGQDRNGSPRLSSLIYRHHPPITQPPPPPHQQPSSTPPPATPYN